MASFVDTRGQRWQVELTVGVALRIRRDLDIDLVQMGASSEGVAELGALLDDSERMMPVLYLCCERQAERRNLSEEGFAGGLDAEVYGRAADALTRAFIGFYPEPSERPPADQDRPAEPVQVLKLCLQLAGVCGVNPNDRTLRELDLMAEARARHDWNRTSAVLAQIHNSGFGATEAMTPADFHPFAEADATGQEPAGVSEAEAKANWSALEGMVSRGAFK